MTITTRAMVSPSVVHVRHRGANGHGAIEDGLHLDRERDPRGEAGAMPLIWSTVSMTLAPGCLMPPDDAGRVVDSRRRCGSTSASPCLADVAHADGRTVAIGQDDVVELLGLRDLVVAAIVKLSLSVLIVPLAALDVEVTSVLRISSSVTPLAARLGRVHLDADRRRTVAEDRDLGNAGHLRDLLREEEIGVIVDEGQRHRLERTENMMMGEVGRVDLLVARRRRHLARQGLAGDGDGRLHVLPAESMLRLRSNWMTIVVAPSALSEVSWLTPGSARTAAQRAATDDAMVSALAPWKLAVTWMVGKSTCGNGATGRNGKETRPTKASAVISSVVATGRRMNGSREFTSCPRSAASGRRDATA